MGEADKLNEQAQAALGKDRLANPPDHGVSPEGVPYQAPSRQFRHPVDGPTPDDIRRAKRRDALDDAESLEAEAQKAAKASSKPASSTSKS